MWAWLLDLASLGVFQQRDDTVILPAGAASSTCGAGWLTDFASSVYTHVDTSILAFRRLEADCYFLFHVGQGPKNGI
jgi:hypothetical protein